MKVFGVDYQFKACGDVFTVGLEHAAAALGVEHAHADWADPDLRAKVDAFAPDLVFVVHGRKWALKWQKPMASCPSAVWLLDEPYEVDDTARWSRQFDHIFVNDASTLDRHPRSVVLPVCYDPLVHFSDDSPRWRRVGFIGGGNPTRDRYLAALAKADLLDYVVGGSWAERDVQARCLSANIPADMTAGMYRQTKVIVNVFREKHHYNTRETVATAMNPRIYEALACGAIVVSEWRQEIADVVPELPTFRTEGECVGIVGALLADTERAEAIRNVCAERLRGHTYAARLQTVLTSVGLAVAA